MASSYAKHGLVALSLRAKRRRHGPADMRTIEGRMAEQVRAGVLADEGGADQASTAMLVAFELLKGEVSTLAAIDKGIKSFLPTQATRSWDQSARYGDAPQLPSATG